MTEPLFEGYADPPVTPGATKLSVDQRRTLRQKAAIANGIHPANGLKLADNGETCGSCTHLFHRHLGGTYLKCAVGNTSGGANSDIRAWWPACPQWEAKT